MLFPGRLVRAFPVQARKQLALHITGPKANINHPGDGFTIVSASSQKSYRKHAGGCIQEHLLEIEVSHLVPDMMQMWGNIETFLEESTRSFGHQQHNSIVTKRKRPRAAPQQ
jgi:hypothetical protein